MSLSKAPKEWHRGQGHWRDVPEEQWRDYRWQLRNRITSVGRLREFLELTPEEEAEIGRAHV